MKELYPKPYPIYPKSDGTRQQKINTINSEKAGEDIGLSAVPFGKQQAHSFVFSGTALRMF